MTKKKQPATYPSPETKPPTVDLAPLVQQVQLRDLRLLRSSCAMQNLGQAKPLPELHQSITVNGARRDDPPSIVVSISFSLVGNYEDGQEGLRVEATFGLVYQVESTAGITTEHINAFAQLIGVNNVWPYWREFVQSMTGRMGLPPLRMPLLRLDQLKFAPRQAQTDSNRPKKSSRKKG